MSTLAPLDCPECRCRLAARDGSATSAECFEDCLRACEACGVGWSNARSNPTAIYRNPLHNIPAEVREGTDTVLASALNLASRDKKRLRFGFSTSEDAVTWTVFRYLQRKELLRVAAELLVGDSIPGIGEPLLLLWGASPDGQAVLASKLHDTLLTISSDLDEGTRFRTEPDVALWFQGELLLVLEAKYLKGSLLEKPGQPIAYHRYVPDTDAFLDGRDVRSSKCYELVRNWRIGWEAADRIGCSRFHFGVLALPKLLDEEDTAIQEFLTSIRISPNRSCRSHTWCDLLSAIPDEAREPWFDRFIASRRLEISRVP